MSAAERRPDPPRQYVPGQRGPGAGQRPPRPTRSQMSAGWLIPQGPRKSRGTAAWRRPRRSHVRDARARRRAARWPSAETVSRAARRRCASPRTRSRVSRAAGSRAASGHRASHPPTPAPQRQLSTASGFSSAKSRSEPARAAAADTPGAQLGGWPRRSLPTRLPGGADERLARAALERAVDRLRAAAPCPAMITCLVRPCAARSASEPARRSASSASDLPARSAPLRSRARDSGPRPRCCRLRRE